MAQSDRNPIELYEAAIGFMLPIIASVRESQLSDSTPCVEWTVQQLILHNIKVAQSVHSGISGGEPVNPFDVGETCHLRALRPRSGQAPTRCSRT